MDERNSYLKRLAPQFYQGKALVHWTMTIDQRKTGWLEPRSHADFREVMLQCLHRYELLCPVYCLMPDHLHVLWQGLAVESDQLRAVSFFRKFFNARLAPMNFRLQKQPHDHVLKEKERERGAFESLMFYIAANPERAELVEDEKMWEFSGSLAAGYPDFDWRSVGFAEKYWGIYARESCGG